MIACLVESLDSEEIIVEGDSFQHLSSSLRVKEGDSVIALNGCGKYRITTISLIKKKSLTLIGGEVFSENRNFKIDIILSPPKKDALNDSLRMACELGVRDIFLMDTEFTQNRKVDVERLSKILKSSVVQSNNKFLPILRRLDNLKDLNHTYDEVFLMDLSDEATSFKSLKYNGEYLILIGPEGGFSERDRLSFKSFFPRLNAIKLKTPILRTPTALCAATAWLISKM